MPSYYFNFPTGYETRGGKKCQFPFYYKGLKWFNDKWYHSCTTAGADFSWCSTKVNNNREHIKLNWDHCDDDGPKGKNDKFLKF